GDGTTVSVRQTPRVVVGVTDAVALAVASSGVHSCVRHGDGHWSCWGWNAYGQLGDGTLSQSNQPVAIAITGEAVATGGASSCVLDAGSVRCWGWNGYGQLGTSEVTYELAPAAVPQWGAPSQLFANRSNTCAIESGTLRCSG